MTAAVRAHPTSKGLEEIPYEQHQAEIVGG
jgi:hypothetical protein